MYFHKKEEALGLLVVDVLNVLLEAAHTQLPLVRRLFSRAAVQFFANHAEVLM